MMGMGDWKQDGVLSTLVRKVSELEKFVRDHLVVDHHGRTTGTYTPTATPVTNIASATPHPCQWFRVGNMVTVSGAIQIDPTAGSLYTRVDLSIPVASNFGNLYECGGVAAGDGFLGQSAAIYANSVFNRVILDFTCGVDHSNYYWLFTFTYQVI